MSKPKKGLFVGNSHADGGIPSKVVETGQLLEIEGDEYYICHEAYNSSQHYDFKGKTNRQILDEIYSEHSCKLVQSAMSAGDFIVCKVVVLDKKKYDRSGTIKEILNEMQGEKSCKVELASGGRLKEGGKVSVSSSTFSDLPRDYQIGVVIRSYEVNEDIDWSVEKDIDWLRDTNDVDVLINDYASHYPDRRFAYGKLPLSYLIRKVEKSGILKKEESFEDYHKEYSKTNKAKHTQATIPILIDPSDEEFIEDGWHRFHRYIDLGEEEIPFVSYDDSFKMKEGGYICPIGTEIQAIILSKDVFKDAEKAKKWVEKSDFELLKTHETSGSFRFRQQTPSRFRESTFRTIPITDGVKAVIGCPKKKMESGGKITHYQYREEVDSYYKKEGDGLWKFISKEEYNNAMKKMQNGGVVDSSDFKKWFGNSAVKNDDGSPKVMYHGSPHIDKIEVFTPTNPDRPFFYFTDDIYEASRYTAQAPDWTEDPSKVGKFYVKAEKIFDPAKATNQELEELFKILDKDPKKYLNKIEQGALEEFMWQVEDDEIEGLSKDSSDSEIALYMMQYNSDNYQILELPEIQEWIKDNGYDAFKTVESGRGMNIAVFSPTQIKSATDNSGAFDPNNPNIKMKDGGGVEKRYSAEADFYVWASSDEDAEKQARELARKVDIKEDNNMSINHLYETKRGIGEARKVFGKGGSVESLSKRLIKKHKGVKTLLLSESDGVISIDMIEVDSDKRKEGVGSSVVQEIVDYADRNQKEIQLVPAISDKRHGTTSRARLVKFYKRFGFVENKGRNKDFSKKGGSMYRLPKMYKGGQLESYERGESFNWDSIPYGKHLYKIYRLFTWIESDRFDVVGHLEKAEELSESSGQEYPYPLEAYEVQDAYDLVTDHKKRLEREVANIKDIYTEEDAKAYRDKHGITKKEWETKQDEYLANKAIGDEPANELIFEATTKEDSYADLKRIFDDDYIDINHIIDIHDKLASENVIFTEEQEAQQYDMFDQPEESEPSNEEIKTLIRGLELQAEYAEKSTEKEELEQLIRGLSAMVEKDSIGEEKDSKAREPKVVRDGYWYRSLGSYVPAEKVDEFSLHGHKWIVGKDEFGTYSVFEDYSGAGLGTHKKKEDAIKDAKLQIEKHHDKLADQLSKFESQGQISPRYSMDSETSEDKQRTNIESAIKSKDVNWLLEVLGNRDNKMSREIYSELTGVSIKNMNQSQVKTHLKDRYGIDIDKLRAENRREAEAKENQSKQEYWESVKGKYPLISWNSSDDAKIIGRIEGILETRYRSNNKTKTQYQIIEDGNYVEKDTWTQKYTRKGDLRKAPKVSYLLQDKDGVGTEVAKMVWDRIDLPVVKK
jgi:predicted GNAT family acetyltransferase